MSNLIGKRYPLQLALIANNLENAVITWKEGCLDRCYFPRACSPDLQRLALVTFDDEKERRTCYSFHGGCYFAFLREYRPDLLVPQTPLPD